MRGISYDCPVRLSMTVIECFGWVSSFFSSSFICEIDFFFLFKGMNEFQIFFGQWSREEELLNPKNDGQRL